MPTLAEVESKIDNLGFALNAELETLNTKLDSLLPGPEKDDFISKYGSRPWTAAGAAATKSVGELKTGALLVQQGDIMGGTAAILNGIGSAANVLALFGPWGAIVGGFMAVFASIISAVLDALKPATRSLEDKIKGLLLDQDLMSTYNQLYGAYKAWQLVQAECTSRAHDRKTDKTKAAGMSWEKLTAHSEWRTHQAGIFTALSTLARSEGKNSKEWMPLYELTIQYTLNFWVGFTVMAALVDDAGVNDYRATREELAAQLRDELYRIQFPAVKEGAWWALYFTEQTGDFSYQEPQPYSEPSFVQNNLYLFTGAFDDGAVLTQENLKGQVISFAIASSTTIFSAGKVGGTYTLCAGRGNSDASPGWRPAPGNPRCDQVFIGERHDGIIKVIALHGGGKLITVFDYDDRIGRDFERTQKDWTPDDRRWLGHQTFTVPDNDTILSLAVDPRSLVDGERLAIYAFAVTSGGGGNCHLYVLDEAKGTVASSRAFHETWMAPPAVRSATFGVAPKGGRGMISPCTVSCGWNTIYAQVGNKAWVYEREGQDQKWALWDLQDEIFYEKLTCHQAYGYDNQSFVCATNKGLRMRYWDMEKNRFLIAREAKIQTLRFARPSSRQVGVMTNLLKTMKEEAPKPAIAPV